MIISFYYFLLYAYLSPYLHLSPLWTNGSETSTGKGGVWHLSLERRTST
jgi:hypothetical protein